jgi:hypothetical protein
MSCTPLERSLRRLYFYCSVANLDTLPVSQSHFRQDSGRETGGPQGPPRASYAAFRALVTFTLICFGLASARLGI